MKWNGLEGGTNSGDCLGYQREFRLLNDGENICVFVEINKGPWGYCQPKHYNTFCKLYNMFMIY